MINSVPFDSALIDKLRAELIDFLEEDYVSPATMQSLARELVPNATREDLRDLITETLATMLDHPDVAVVDGAMSRRITDVEDLRQHIAATWFEDGFPPGAGQVAWAVPPDFDVNYRPHTSG